MGYREVIFKYAPPYWSKLDEDEDKIDLQNNSQEYEQIAYEVRQAISNHNKTFQRIVRIQNVHDLGQLLVREQLLITAHMTTSYFRVRRFIKIQERYLENALRFNLDYRRCGLSAVVFTSSIPYNPGDVLLVVQVVTSNPDNPEIRPTNTLEYFIDYVVYL